MMINWDQSVLLAFTVITNLCRRQKSLYTLLLFTSELVDEVSKKMSADHYQWQRTVLGHNFSVSRIQGPGNGEGSSNIVHGMRTWLYAHEDAQVMVASVLVVVGLWWLVRAVLNLVINLICPLLVVLLAVICVPQLRAPLLGQNYPMLANLVFFLSKLKMKLDNQKHEKCDNTENV